MQPEALPSHEAEYETQDTESDHKETDHPHNIRGASGNMCIHQSGKNLHLCSSSLSYMSRSPFFVYILSDRLMYSNKFLMFIINYKYVKTDSHLLSAC